MFVTVIIFIFYLITDNKLFGYKNTHTNYDQEKEKEWTNGRDFTTASLRDVLC
jgi:hypothetical protein